MAVKRIAAENLIELAISALREELQPHLPAAQRYTAAMIANALEIARRELLADGGSEQWRLLDAIYAEGESDLGRLASDIRAGKVSTATHPDLAARLRALLLEELRIRNPRFLKSRDGER